MSVLYWTELWRGNKQTDNIQDKPLHFTNNGH